MQFHEGPSVSSLVLVEYQIIIEHGLPSNVLVSWYLRGKDPVRATIHQVAEGHGDSNAKDKMEMFASIDPHAAQQRHVLPMEMFAKQRHGLPMEMFA